MLGAPAQSACIACRHSGRKVGDWCGRVFEASGKPNRLFASVPLPPPSISLSYSLQAPVLLRVFLGAYWSMLRAMPWRDNIDDFLGAKRNSRSTAVFTASFYCPFGCTHINPRAIAIGLLMSAAFVLSGGLQIRTLEEQRAGNPHRFSNQAPNAPCSSSINSRWCPIAASCECVRPEISRHTLLNSCANPRMSTSGSIAARSATQTWWPFEG